MFKSNLSSDQLLGRIPPFLPSFFSYHQPACSFFSSFPRSPTESFTGPARSARANPTDHSTQPRTHIIHYRVTIRLLTCHIRHYYGLTTRKGAAFRPTGQNTHRKRNAKGVRGHPMPTGKVECGRDSQVLSQS